jgi:hypothetical protein
MKDSYEYKIDERTKISINATDNRFSVVYLFFTDKWTDIARADNYPHNGRTGTHIHRLGEDSVEFRDMDIYESIGVIARIGEGIKERIKNGLH